jgi:hypothetical protein
MFVLLIALCLAVTARATNLLEYVQKGEVNKDLLFEALMNTPVSDNDEENWAMLDLLSIDESQAVMHYLIDYFNEFAPRFDTETAEYKAALKEMVTKHVENEKKALDPVVFIPGFLASALNCHKARVTSKRLCPSNRGEYQCWLSIPKIVRLRCFGEEFTREYTGNGGYQYNLKDDFYADGVDFGGIDGAEGINKFLDVPIMGGMIDAFEAVGYRAGVSFRTATYDWTFTGQVYEDDNSVMPFFGMLKNLIEETYRENGNKKVNLIGHSMGTYQGHWFLSSGYVNSTWKDQYIKNMMDITPLYRGAPLGHRALLTGLTPIPLVKWYLRTLVANWGSVHAFLPFNWNETAFVITDDDTFYEQDTVRLYDYADKPWVGQAYPFSHEVYKKMQPHGVPYHCFLVTNVTTECGADYRGTNNWYETPASIACDGDVLVPSYSARFCTNLNPQSYQEYAGEGLNHLSILNYIPLLDQLIDIATR